MPTVSPAQHRLMEAAAHSPGGFGGVPQSVGEEFVAKDGAMRAAGTIFFDPEGRILLLRRSPAGDHGGEWGIPGGGIEEGESAIEAALREAREETGFADEVEPKFLHRCVSDEDVDFTTLIAGVPSAFDPELNDEHDGYVWADLSNLPSPLHPGLLHTLSEMRVTDAPSGAGSALPGGGFSPFPASEDAPASSWGDVLSKFATDEMALDRAVLGLRASSEVLAFDRSSVRSYDADGRLHVEVTNISKANICPYLGREIPDWQALGLSADRIYHLFRDPEELARGAATFNNLPLLSRHVPVSSVDPHSDIVIGSTGTDARFEAPYLKNSLVIWTINAIDDIESETKKELSSAYRYRADMTPGIYEGVKYDGVMRDIVGNHVALVKEGRAGADVVVGDSTEEIEMAMKKVSLRGAMTHGALVAYLAPKLAADAKIDLRPALLGVNSKNFKARKNRIADAVRRSVSGHLAADANIDDLIALLDAVGTVPVEEDAEPGELDPSAALPVEGKEDEGETAEGGAEEDDDKAPAVDSAALAKAREFLAGKLSDADMNEYMAIIGASGEGAEDDEADGDPSKNELAEENRDKANDEEDDEMKDMVTKPAMDAAISAAVADVRKAERAIREAERAVRPLVGEMAGAFDSADEVYRKACEIVGIKTDGVHPSAYPALLDMHRSHSAKPARATSKLGMDEASSKSFNERAPGAAGIRVL